MIPHEVETTLKEIFTSSDLFFLHVQGRRRIEKSSTVGLLLQQLKKKHLNITITADDCFMKKIKTAESPDCMDAIIQQIRGGEIIVFDEI